MLVGWRPQVLSGRPVVVLGAGVPSCTLWLSSFAFPLPLSSCGDPASVGDPDLSPPGGLIVAGLMVFCLVVWSGSG